MSIILKSYPEYKDSGLPWLGRFRCIGQPIGSSGMPTWLRGLSHQRGSPVRRCSSVWLKRTCWYHNTPNTLGPCIIVGRKGSFGKVNYSPQPVFAIDTTFS